MYWEISYHKSIFVYFGPRVYVWVLGSLLGKALSMGKMVCRLKRVTSGTLEGVLGQWKRQDSDGNREI